MIHKLKTWPRFYEEVCRGDKTFEIRRDDREFTAGDFLILQEWDRQTEQYTGREVAVYVSFVTSLRPLYHAVGMSIRLYTPERLEMKLAYVAGPYRAQSEWELIQNIRRAEALAVELWQIGFAVFCPHTNSAHLGGSCREEVFLNGGLEILSRCDVVVCTHDWEKSAGAKAEIVFAHKQEIPIMFSVEQAAGWLRGQTE